MASREPVEVYGTIYQIAPIESGLQKVSTLNTYPAAGSTPSVPIDDRLVLNIQQSAYPRPIPVELNTPITAKGYYTPKTATSMAYVNRIFEIKYKGVIYK